MDDKPPELAAMQEKVLKTLEVISTAIAELAKQLQESNEREQARLKQEMARLSAVPTQTYLAGQFRRRDGDGYATIPRKFGSAEPSNADHKTGDL